MLVLILLMVVLWKTTLGNAQGASLPTAQVSATPYSEVTVSLKPVVSISPLLYGVSYTWNNVPAKSFPAWNEAMRTVAHYTLVQYPGGWCPEHHDWISNSEPSWHYSGTSVGFNPAVEQPGIDPDGLLAVAPAVNLTTPSLPAINNPASIPTLVATTTELVRKYGDRVKLWDIGNEWWIQRGGQKFPAIRKQNLERYAALVAAVVPAMKAINPSIQVYAGGDWQSPEEFKTMRLLVGPQAWAKLDGVSIHTYLDASNASVDSIPQVVEKIRNITGKENIFDSQWVIRKADTPNDYGIKNANKLVFAFQAMAFARIKAGIIWPVIGYVPALNFVASDYTKAYASGILFGWMSQYYEGMALQTGGDLPAVAAENGQSVTVIIPSGVAGTRHIQLFLPGRFRIISAQVLCADDPNNQLKSRIAKVLPLPTTTTQENQGTTIIFTLNPATGGRGAGWEIARITLQS